MSSKKVKGVINIYPNPVIDILAVNYISSDNSEGLITVSDDKGVLILSTSMEWLQGENKVEINTSNYAKGLYLITFYDAGNLYHKRFIKK